MKRSQRDLALTPFSIGAAPPFGRVGLCQGSQVCSAHRFFRFAQKARSGLRPPPTIPQPMRALCALLDSIVPYSWAKNWLNWRTAWPLWLSCCFSARVIWAKLRS